MHMIGHQCIGVQVTGFFLKGFTQPVQVGVVVLFREEARLAIVAALHDMQRYAIDMDAGSARHALTLLQVGN